MGMDGVGKEESGVRLSFWVIAMSFWLLEYGARTTTRTRTIGFPNSVCIHPALGLKSPFRFDRV